MNEYGKYDNDYFEIWEKWKNGKNVLNRILIWILPLLQGKFDSPREANELLALELWGVQRGGSPPFGLEA